MLVNVTQSRLVVGRINILPGDKVPPFTRTDAEEKGIQRFVKRGYLVEKQQKPVVQQKPKPKPKVEDVKPKSEDVKPVEQSKPEMPKEEEAK